MDKLLTLNDFIDTPDTLILDVRTPAEYINGHIRGAVNLPLFSDEERAEVGTLYVRESREAAVERGLEIVGPKLKQLVTQARELSDGRTIHIYCWRGGMRSGSMQWLLDTAGLRTARLKGGYKAYRADFERLISKTDWKFKILAGPTGCGKTSILNCMTDLGEQVLDLEGLANHKGSVFGALGQQKQPTTEEFINRIHHILRSLDSKKIIWVEGESITIGHVFIPPFLFSQLTSSPIVNLEIPPELRLKRVMAEYGSFPAEKLSEAFKKIEKRLGYDNCKFALDAISKNDIETAAKIALVYYDKSYQSSIAKRTPINSISITCDTDNAKDNALKIIELCRQ